MWNVLKHTVAGVLAFLLVPVFLLYVIKWAVYDFAHCMVLLRCAASMCT
jgi:hypothetical protein